MLLLFSRNINTLQPRLLTESYLLNMVEQQLHQANFTIEGLNFLQLFFFHYNRLKAAGSLLCPLTEFYRSLHSNLQYRITKDRAQKVYLSEAVESLGSGNLQEKFNELIGWL